MKRLKIITVLTAVVIFFLGSINVAQAKNNEEKIYKNIYIENIDVSELTRQEAQNKIENFIKEHNQIVFSNGDNKFVLNISDIEVNYNVRDCVQEAYNIGRDKNVISNIKTKVNLELGEAVNINLNKSYNNEKMQSFIEKIEKGIRISPINASIRLEDENLVYEKETYGIGLDTGKFKRIIISKINKMDYEKEEIPTVTIKPKYLYDDICKINSVLGTYETYFNPNIYNRVNNIRVGAKATSNIILNPTEEFSFNSYIQSPDIKGQFKKAPVIINGKLKEGSGGGLCQVSSTLYNAALYAGLEITNVKNHSIPSSYISKGRDATISTGDIDLKFKNNFETPIFIIHKVYDNKIVSTIYGNETNKKDIEIITEIVKSLPYKIKCQQSDKLYEGQQSIYQKGRKGYTVNTFRIYKGNGDVVKELIKENYYPPMDKIVIYGTKKKIQNNNLNGEVI
ncbi:VanW family protein [Romboutsia lituseburensis]|uniref:VanW family protein n=1 Tax=Romboutsia lituseburensis TaxID=1537 RepID=UPI00215A83B0|nr:VanW family protein [Romboutsia lituseburensis]MCR8745603.1 VanW family protein [Romboutsia lituseburensis]